MYLIIHWRNNNNDTNNNNNKLLVIPSQDVLYLLLFHINENISVTITKASFIDENIMARSSTTFSNYIRNVPIVADKTMVSYDVFS